MTLTKTIPGVYRLILRRHERNAIAIYKGSKAKMLSVRDDFRTDMWPTYEMFIVNFRGEIVC